MPDGGGEALHGVREGINEVERGQRLVPRGVRGMGDGLKEGA